MRAAEESALLARTGATYESIVVKPKLKQDLLNMITAMFLFLIGAAAEATAAAERAG